MTNGPCVHGVPNLGEDCQKCVRSWLNLKLAVEVKQRLPDAVFTCETCPDNDTCPAAWDTYNQDGDCLMEK